MQVLVLYMNTKSILFPSMLHAGSPRNRSWLHFNDLPQASSSSLYQPRSLILFFSTQSCGVMKRELNRNHKTGVLVMTVLEAL